MKKVIVISTSLRCGSNSDMLADKFVEGAVSAGNDGGYTELVGKGDPKNMIPWDKLEEFFFRREGVPLARLLRRPHQEGDGPHGAALHPEQGHRPLEAVRHGPRTDHQSGGLQTRLPVSTALHAPVQEGGRHDTE